MYQFDKKRVNWKCDFKAVSGRTNYIFGATLNLEPKWIFAIFIIIGRASCVDGAAVSRMMMSHGHVVDDTLPARIWCRISIVQARGSVTPTITLEHLKTIWARNLRA